MTPRSRNYYKTRVTRQGGLDMIWDFSFGRLFGSLFICWARACQLPFRYSSLNNWYAQLIKPKLRHPVAVFTLCPTPLSWGWEAFSLNEDTKRVEVKKALLLFIMQLLLSVLWSSSFFGLRSLWISALVSVLLFLVLFKQSAAL